MRSTSEHAEECYREGELGHRDSGSDIVEEPGWIMVEAGKSQGISEMFAPALNRLCKAIEKDIKNVGKN